PTHRQTMTDTSSIQDPTVKTGPSAKCQSLLDFFRTKNFVASSDAALVSERRYKSITPNKSTQVLKKFQENQQAFDS
ncbi:hypothetical protein, partial [Neorhizobium lilium]|uniref:hypothetical protein n=1 Tax=Neorhizobium lilium TaxID=2503024 RepID=UPI001980CE0F